jgi:hypothetical protein
MPTIHTLTSMDFLVLQSIWNLKNFLDIIFYFNNRLTRINNKKSTTTGTVHSIVQSKNEHPKNHKTDKAANNTDNWKWGGGGDVSWIRNADSGSGIQIPDPKYRFRIRNTDSGSGIQVPDPLIPWPAEWTTRIYLVLKRKSLIIWPFL